MDVTFFQTADAFLYETMLRATSRTVIEYCRRGGYAYESFIGLKRGYWPWQATYNRVFMLGELVSRGFRGWAAYLDADAFIVDLAFDLRSYLADKADKAAILTPSMATDHAWDVNNGVCFINLGVPDGRDLVAEWLHRVSALSEGELRDARNWDDIAHDQSLLQDILREQPRVLGRVYLQSTDLMNSSFGTFIRQHLRGYTPDLEARIAAIQSSVERVVATAASPERTAAAALPEATVAADVVAALYEGILGRAPDQEGGQRAEAAMGMVGLRAGTRGLSRDMIASAEFRSRLMELLGSEAGR